MKKILLRIIGFGLIFYSLFTIGNFVYSRYTENKYSNQDKSSVKEYLDNFDEDKLIIEETNSQIYEEESENPVEKEKPIGVLSIKKINLEVGFYNESSKRNNVKYGLQILETSSMPNKPGQLIIASHNGRSSVAYFRNLHKLELGDEAIIYYLNKKYYYKLEKTDIQEKTGTLKIEKNSKYPLVLITCTKAGGTTQTIYYFSKASK